MDETQSELELAWEELTFWRDFAVWWKSRHINQEEPRIQEALGNAELRYERVVRQIQWE
jgi:hypothetical protein